MISPSFGDKQTVAGAVEDALRLYERELDALRKDLYLALEKAHLILLKLRNHADDVKKARELV